MQSTDYFLLYNGSYARVGDSSIAAAMPREYLMLTNRS